MQGLFPPKPLSPGMRPETSVFLDLVRFCAALVVAFDNLADYTNGLLWQLGSFGAAAVDVFFVLSGYVIAHAIANRERDFSRYAISRCARLYSVVLPALIIGFVLGTVGTALRPSVEWGDTSLTACVRCLLFTNEIWFSNVTPGYNGPFWSLGYEPWYYLIFAGAYFGKGIWRYTLTLLAIAMAGPRIFMMFPLWLMGLAAWTLPTRVSIAKVSAGLLWFGSSALLAGLVAWHLHLITGEHPPPDAVPTMQRDLTNWRPYMADYGIGPVVALNFLSFNALAPYWSGLPPIFGHTIRWLAGATFTLYLLHVPVAQFLAAMSPWPVGTLSEQMLVMLGTFSVVFLVAEYTERRKTAWRKVINSILALKPRRLPT